MSKPVLPLQFPGQPAYRLKQVYQAVFKDCISDWEQATVLPKALRQQCAGTAPLSYQTDFYKSKDNRTTKATLTLSDDSVIETVLMRYPGRNSVCVSCQVGCPVNCSFCATGQMGFKRNLTVWEIVSQVLVFARLLKEDGERVQSVVYMGMGEPFLNYDAVLSSIRLLNDPNAFGLGARHISISTSGIVPGIKKFTQENLEVNLAISLHAPNDTLRSELMPINNTYPLRQVMAVVTEYVRTTNRRVMFEYLLIDGLNDTEECALQLAELMDQPLFMVNVIPYNPTGKYKPASSKKVKEFIQTLRQNHVAVTQRFSFGQDIKAACGQLATNRHRTDNK
ncbi:MAG: 23S rRNA (adenine(2503)-C(2))-methyltransferase RlmN [Patescibacteria group bacterium]